MRFVNKIKQVTAAEHYVPWLNEATEAALKAIMDVYQKKTGKKMDPARAEKIKKKMELWADEEIEHLWN